MIRTTKWIFILLLFISQWSIAGSMGNKVEFESGNPLGFQQLLTPSILSKQTIVGYLSIPENKASKKMPVVVMISGSGGLQTWYQKYVKLFNNLGIITLQIDSFTPRSVKNTISDQSAVSLEMMLADSFAAFRYLKKHPSVDPQKIAIMGWSKGGTVSYMAAFSDLVKAQLGKQDKFRAHIFFYPSCLFDFESTQLDGSPWLYLHGAEDDYTQMTQCLAFIGQVAKKVPVNAIIYPKAQHSFDSLQPVTYLPKAQNPRECHAKLNDKWEMVDLSTGNVLNDLQKVRMAYAHCMRLGAHVGGDREAANDALWQVSVFAQKYLLGKR